MFDYTIADTIQQAASFPLGLLIWIRLLALVNLSSLFWVRRPQGRWVLVAFTFITVFNVGMIVAGTGLIKLFGLPHVLAWIPLVAYLAHQFRSGQLDVKKPFGIWCLLVMLMNLVSVVFDLRDSFQYLMGDRAPILIDPNAGLPYITLVVIVVSIASVLTYSFGVTGGEKSKLPQEET